MKKIITTLFSLSFLLTMAQTSTEVVYKKADLKNGVQSGSIANLKNITTVNVVYDFKEWVFNGKAVGEKGHISEADFISKKSDKCETEEKGKGAEFKKNWELGKTSDFPLAFETLFNKYAKKDINMVATNNKDAEYTLIVRTTKVEPGYKMGMAAVLPYIDVEFVFTDKNGKELVTIFFKAVLPSAVGAPVYMMHKNLVPSYEKAAKKLVDFIKEER